MERCSRRNIQNDCKMKVEDKILRGMLAYMLKNGIESMTSVVQPTPKEKQDSSKVKYTITIKVEEI